MKVKNETLNEEIRRLELHGLCTLNFCKHASSFLHLGKLTESDSAEYESLLLLHSFFFNDPRSGLASSLSTEDFQLAVGTPRDLPTRAGRRLARHSTTEQVGWASLLDDTMYCAVALVVTAGASSCWMAES